MFFFLSPNWVQSELTSCPVLIDNFWSLYRSKAASKIKDLTAANKALEARIRELEASN